MTIDIAQELRADNPKTSGVDLAIYADALRAYIEATRNIAQNGTICAHPRTGQPIENPYVKVRNSQAAILTKMGRIKGDRVMAILSAEMA